MNKRTPLPIRGPRQVAPTQRPQAAKYMDHHHPSAEVSDSILSPSTAAKSSFPNEASISKMLPSASASRVTTDIPDEKSLKTAAQRLQKFLARTSRNSECGSLMGVEVVQRALKICRPAAVDIHCLARRDNSYIPSLSTSLQNGKLILYADQQRLSKLVAGLSKERCTVGNTYNVQVYLVCRLSRSAETIADLLCRICEHVRRASLVDRNLREDYVTDRIHALEDAMRQSSGTFKESDLCRFIKQHEKVLGQSLSIPPRLSSVSKIPEIKRSKGYLPVNESCRHIIEECRNTGRPYYGFRRHRSQPVYFMIFPVKRGPEIGPRISSLLLIYDRRPLGFRLAYLISELVFHYMAVRHTHGQIQTLVETHRAVDPLHTRSRLNGFQHLRQLLLAFVAPLLGRALNNTRAHSACMRVFSLDDRSLHVFIDCATELGARKQRDKISENLWQQSVVAFTFHTGGTLSHTYIPLTSSAPLPNEYHTLGLRSVLSVRENTRSELCFPLFCGDVCVGTLNFESPVPDGFNEDIPFLQAIRLSIEAYYN